MPHHTGPHADPDSLLRRSVDRLGAALLLLLLLPLLIVVSVAVLVSSGRPVLFRQERLGLHGQTFQILKFRTMVVDAVNSGTGLFTEAGDPRITRVGAFLRATSLDELPQLLNIVRGEMTFVGPRPPVPHWPHEYADYPDRARTRFTVRPGVTGLSQVRARNAAPWPVRLEHDAEYVERRSLALDVKILWQTIWVVVLRRNLYRDQATADAATGERIEQ